MSRLVSSLQAVARYEVERRSYCELAVVTSVFDSGDGPDAQSVSVRLRDSGEVLNRVPVAVPVSGLAALPRIDDVVVLLFARGEAASPLVIAKVYGDARPPAATKDEMVIQWPSDAESPDSDAAVVGVKATGSEREIRFELGGDKDASLKISDGSVELTTGGVSMVLSHSSKSDAKASIEAGGTLVELNQDGDLKIVSAKKLTLEAKEIELKADVSVKVNGQTVEIN